MPRKLTELQLTKKHIRTCHDLVNKIEKELADEATDRSERTRLLTSLAELNKEIRSLENKKAKLAKAKPHGTRLIGFHHLQEVFRADRCLTASYRWNGRTLTVVIPDSENQMSMPRYNAYVASRDAAEKIARSLQGLERQSTVQQSAKTEQQQAIREANDIPAPVAIPDIKVSAETIESIGTIMGSAPPKTKAAHTCGDGCRLFGCSIQDALQAAKAATKAAAVSEPATAIEPVPEAVDQATVSEAVSPGVGEPATSGDSANTGVVAPERASGTPEQADHLSMKSDAEILRWLRNQTSKQATITPDPDLDGETLQYWIDKAKITVKRMMELYRGFSVTLSREASMQFDNFRDRHLIPMLGKILFYEPETAKAILGEDAAILLDNSGPPAKPVIDTNTQILTELKWRGKTWAPAPLPRLTGYFGPPSDLEKREE